MSSIPTSTADNIAPITFSTPQALIAATSGKKKYKSLAPPPSPLSDDEPVYDGYIVSWKNDESTKNEYGRIVKLSADANSDLPNIFTSYLHHKLHLISKNKHFMCNLNQAANADREEFRERLEAIREDNALTFVPVVFARIEDNTTTHFRGLEARYFEMRPPTAYQLKLQRDASILRQGTLVEWKTAYGFIEPDDEDKHLFDHKDIFFSGFAFVPDLTADQEALALSCRTRNIRVKYGAFKSEEGDRVAVHVKIVPLELPAPKSQGFQVAASAAASERAPQLDPHNEILRQTSDRLDKEATERHNCRDAESGSRVKLERDREAEIAQFAIKSVEMVKEIQRKEKQKLEEETGRRNELASRLPRINRSLLGIDLNDETLELGSGSTSIVYACSYHGSQCAAKIFHRHIASNKNLLHEMSAANQVRHSNVLNLLSIIVSDKDSHKIVGLLMERMTGTLLERVKLIEGFKDAHPPTRLQLLTWCAQTAAAIAWAHSQQTIHCDIKPENVMLDQHHNAKLSDFGSAHVMSTVATEVTGVRGTALYVAPELTKGAKDIKPSKKTDVFSFGMLMWVVFHPSNSHGMGETFIDITLALGRGERPDVTAADLPAEIVSLIQECWHEDPSKRPDMTEVVRTLASHNDALFKRSQLAGKLRFLRDEKMNHIDQILDQKTRRKLLAQVNFMDIPTRVDELEKAIKELDYENLDLTQIIQQQTAAHVDDNINNNDDSDDEDDEDQYAQLENADTRRAHGQVQSEVSLATTSAVTTKRTTFSNAFTGAPSATSSEMRQVQNDDDLFCHFDK